MAKLPVYTNSANIQVVGGVKVDNSGTKQLAQAGQNFGNTIQDLTVKWQKTQNAAETLDGKNKAASDTNDILTEAEEFTDYKTPKELEDKERELSDRMSRVMPDVASGFTNDRNREAFINENKMTELANMQKLKGIFRKKYIDNNAANLTMSYERNRDAYLSSGNEAYKQNYMADLERSFKAGYISEEQKTNAVMKTKDWNFGYASQQLMNDPEGTLKNISSYGLKPNQKQQLLTAVTTQIKNKKMFDGLDRLVQEGTEGNRLYNKYMSEGISLDEISNASISTNEKTALMKLAGYDSAQFIQNQKSAESITKQLELDDKIKETIKVRSRGASLQNGKDIQDLLALRQDVYDAVINYGLSKDKASKYLNNIVGAGLKEAKNIVDRKDVSGAISSPYAEGLTTIDTKIAAMGIDNDMTRAGVHNLYFEAMADQMQKTNGVDWADLSEKDKENIQRKAISYAMENVPNVAEAKSAFNQYLPPSARKAALDEFMSQYDKDMTSEQKNQITGQIINEKQKEARAVSDLAVANAAYAFSDTDREFLTSNNFTPEEVVYTANLRGLSVEKVLEKLKGK
jgi:ribosomal protein L7/L12